MKGHEDIVYKAVASKKCMGVGWVGRTCRCTFNNFGSGEGGGDELELYCHEKFFFGGGGGGAIAPLAPPNYVGTMSGLLKKFPVQVLHDKAKIQDFRLRYPSTDTHKAGNRVNQRYMSWIRCLGYGITTMSSGFEIGECACKCAKAFFCVPHSHSQFWAP